MKGLEVVEINFSDLLDEYSKFRLDAEFHKKEYVKYLEKIKSRPYIKIKEDSFVTDGIHSSIDFDENSNVNLISAKSPKENYFDLNSNHYISKSQHIDNPRTALKENDVIISTVGTIGNVAVVTKDILPANSDRHVGIVRVKKELQPYYLSTFLLSKYGRFQTFRESTGNVQLNLFIYKINNILVPKLSSSFQNRITEICLKSYNNSISSKEKYKKAENLLLEEIGLREYQPNEKGINIKSFSESFGNTGRLDAEYYQPKYEFIENAIKNYYYGYNNLDYYIDNYSTGYPFKSKSYIQEGGIPLIRINNINKGSLDISNSAQIPLEDSELSPKDVATENDILISMSGTIGNSCRIPEGITALINQRIMRITPKNYNNQVLPLVINSIIGEYQLNRIGTGAVQTNISPTDIKDILIPDINKKVQSDIAVLIEQSFSLKEQSEQFLETAKKAVEIAIEENEEIALKFLNTNF